MKTDCCFDHKYSVGSIISINASLVSELRYRMGNASAVLENYGTGQWRIQTFR